MATYGSIVGKPVQKTATEFSVEVKDEPRGFIENAAPYVSEFAGTFMIVFTIGCCSICGEPMWNPTGVAFTVLTAVYSFFPISGGHLNPAVTIALGCVGKFSWAKLPGYLIAQCLGGYAGCLAYWSIFDTTVSLGPPENSHWMWYDVVIIESLYTFMLCFVYMNCVASDRNNRECDQNHFFALAAGLVYVAGGYPSLPISGSIFNPAASLAMGTTSSNWGWSGIYTAAQVGGAWIASVIYPMIRIEDFPRLYTVVGSLEEFQSPIATKLLSEFIGTFLIVITYGLNAVSHSPAGPWSYAGAYTCLFYSLGDVSGGHFNPAVTLAAMLTGRGVCGFALSQSYILHQLGAGACAGLAFYHFDDHTTDETGFPLGPKADYKWSEVGMSESLLTALVAFAFLAIATSTMPPSTTKTNFYSGLAIGSCITIGGFAIGAISGGLLNPAVALGKTVCEVLASASFLNIAEHWQKLWKCLWFAVFECGGGACAAMLFFITHQKEYHKDGSNYPHIP